MDRQPADLDLRAVEPVEHGPQRGDVAVTWHLQGQGLVVARDRVEDVGGRFQLVRAGELQADVATGDTALQLSRGALSDDPAVIEEANEPPIDCIARLTTEVSI